MAIRVLIADDHPIIFNSVRSFLGLYPDIEVVGIATSGQEAIAMTRKLEPDILVLDFKLPDHKGSEVIAEVKAITSSLKILVFSAFARREYVESAFDNGASGYLTKDEPLEVLVEAIRGVANGEQGWLSRKIKGELMSIIQQKEGGGPKITNRETEIVTKIAEGKTNQQIAYELHLSPKTVEKSVYKLYQKLGARSRVELAVRSIRRNGL